MPMQKSQVHKLHYDIQTPAGESILLKPPKEAKLSPIKPADIKLQRDIQQNMSASHPKVITLTK